MRRNCKFFHPGLFACLLALGLGTTALQAETMTAGAVIANAVARSQHSQTNTLPDIRYTKITVTEEFDPAGNVTERKQKTYNISCRDGESQVSLVDVNGHPPEAADLKKQVENEKGMRQLLGQPKAAPGDNRENFLTPEIVSRFDFQLIGETNINNRLAYQISFQPKIPEPPVHRLIDRLLNRISGTLWIDQEEFEISRADVFLRSEVNLLGGIAGSLKKLAYTMVRTRVADGLWLNTLSSGDFQGRKFLNSAHIKTKSESTNFEPAG